MNENTKSTLICVGIVALLFFVAFGNKFCSNGEKDKNYICSSCNREYTNRDDVNSIIRTSMCEPCYDDFKYIQELYDEAEKYKERNR